MNKSIKSFAGVFVAVGAFLPSAWSQMVTLSESPFSFSVGGEFNGVTTGNNFLPNYSPEAIVGNGFETFCIETMVDFDPGSTYTYNLSQTSSIGQALTEGTALLYYDFATGQLPGYDYTDTGTRINDAGALQAAIWALQGGQSWTTGTPPFPSGTVNNVYYEYATNTLGLAAAESPSDGAFGVDVLEMWDGNGAPAQNQLVLTGNSAPDGGQTLLMLGIALPALAVFKTSRNLAKVRVAKK